MWHNMHGNLYYYLDQSVCYCKGYLHSMSQTKMKCAWKKNMVFLTTEHIRADVGWASPLILEWVILTDQMLAQAEVE